MAEPKSYTQTSRSAESHPQHNRQCWKVTSFHCGLCNSLCYNHFVPTTENFCFRGRVSVRCSREIPRLLDCKLSQELFSGVRVGRCPGCKPTPPSLPCRRSRHLGGYRPPLSAAYL